jgi:hypothetical protein
MKRFYDGEYVIHTNENLCFDYVPNFLLLNQNEHQEDDLLQRFYQPEIL